MEAKMSLVSELINKHGDEVKFINLTLDVGTACALIEDIVYVIELMYCNGVYHNSINKHYVSGLTYSIDLKNDQIMVYYNHRQIFDDSIELMEDIINDIIN